MSTVERRTRKFVPTMIVWSALDTSFADTRTPSKGALNCASIRLDSPARLSSAMSFSVASS
jgi:hypothetical protein